MILVFNVSTVFLTISFLLYTIFVVIAMVVTPLSTWCFMRLTKDHVRALLNSLAIRPLISGIALNDKVHLGITSWRKELLEWIII